MNEFFGFKDRDFDDCLSFEEFMGEETTLGKEKKQQYIFGSKLHVLFRSASVYCTHVRVTTVSKAKMREYNFHDEMRSSPGG